MRKIDMTTGDIGKILIALSMPIIAANFMQTAFGMADMIWIGRLGSGAVSAIGTASFYINLATALSTLIVIGTGIRIAQSIGAHKSGETAVYVKNSVLLSLLISAVFCIVVGLFATQLIAFFEMGDIVIETMAKDYLLYSLIGIPLMFLTLTFTTVLTSYGDTKIIFKANFIGLIINIVLDPIMIFGFAFIPGMGVVGAAIATIIARMITFVIMLYSSREYILPSWKAKLSVPKMLEVCRMSIPVTFQRVIFIFISIYMAKIIVRFGTDAIAAQKIGIQIESISYMTIGGIQGAIAAFVGQNYGAGKLERMEKGFNVAAMLVIFFGTLVSLAFIIFPNQLFRIFIDDASVIATGTGYMRTLGYSQLFMCIELLSVGAFNGIGRTYAPPIIAIIFSALRIPIALWLSQFMGIDGVWWSISVTSIFKGIILTVWFKVIVPKEIKVANLEVRTV